MRTGLRCRQAVSIIAANCGSRLLPRPTLPGLMRYLSSASAQAGCAASSLCPLKWKSPTSGTSQSAARSRSRTCGTAAAASSVLTVTRTSSEPASASSRTWRAVASTSAVSVLVIDWTTTGAPPPTVTAPMRTATVLRRAAITSPSGPRSTASTVRSRMSSGTAPVARTVSWNARMSKRSPSACFGARAQLQELQLADLVGERLARVGDVAVDLVDDVGLGLGRVRHEVVDGLLARPVHVVDAGVDDEAHGAPQVVGELPEARVRILVEAEVVAEPLGVERPAFDVGREAAGAPEHRQVGLLLRERDLQVMARHRLVHRQHLHLVLRPHLGAVEVHVVVAGARTVERRALVVGGRRVRRAVVRDRPQAERRAVELAEELRQLRVDHLHDVGVGAEQLVARLVVELRVGAQVLEELGQRALEARPRP